MENKNILEQIHKAALKFLAPFSAEETYKMIVLEAVRLVNAEYGSIVLEVDGELKRVYSTSSDAFKVENRKRGNTYTAFTKRKVVIAHIQETGKFHPELYNLGISSTIFIPLSYQDKSIGVLTINSKKKIDANADELKILKLFGSLASLVIRKTQLFDETKKALETRDHFISIASHELRTPLTSINGYIQLLLNKFKNQNTVEANWVKELYAESARLTNLVIELLEVNNMKAGQLQFDLKECSLLDIINTSVDRLQLNHPESKVVFQNYIKENNSLVIGDEVKLTQVVFALLTNAEKFSPNDKHILIILKNSKSHVIIQIIDHGAGISEDNIKKIFEGFYKGANNYMEGMGVGLLLAKYIISYHHGTIYVKSKEKKGTKVEVRLPRMKL